MSEDARPIAKFLIEPEPTQAELVAILVSLQPAPVAEPEAPSPSRWTETARREQLRQPLDDRHAGWKR